MQPDDAILNPEDTPIATEQAPLTAPAKLTTRSTPLEASELANLHAYWRAANYLSVGQIYLMANPLLREPLRLEHVKPRMLGHLGHHAWPQLRLRPHEPGYKGFRSERHL